MTHTTASRRLVKSPPELWAELSSEESLGRHLAEFGEIRIIRVEPETTVAWEGDRASGTVELAPTGWGTKVILTAQPGAQPDPPPAVAEVAAAAQPALAATEVAAAAQPPPAATEVVAAAQPPPAATQPAPQPRRGFLARLFRRRPPVAEPPAAGIPGPPLPTPDPAPPTPAPDPSPLPPAPDPVPPAPAPEPPAPQIEVLDPARTAAILDVMLDELGAAHHRPFSRD